MLFYFLNKLRDRRELEKVQNEVDQVLNGRTATFDDIPNLPKVKNAITVHLSFLSLSNSSSLPLCLALLSSLGSS
jgi:hypothetical protein